MSENTPPIANQSWILRPAIYIILGLLLFARIGYGQIQTADQVILQGSIQIESIKQIQGDQTNKIQPGTPVKLSVTIENNGQQTSPPGQLYVRYAFAHPLEHEATSVIFQTEKKTLPPIEPGKTIHMTFDTSHQIPSVLDFVRYDWSIREYQALAVINQEEHMIGTLAITFSAYYYPGTQKEFPTKIPHQQSLKK